MRIFYANLLTALSTSCEAHKLSTSFANLIIVLKALKIWWKFSQLLFDLMMKGCLSAKTDKMVNVNLISFFPIIPSLPVNGERWKEGGKKWIHMEKFAEAKVFLYFTEKKAKFSRMEVCEGKSDKENYCFLFLNSFCFIKKRKKIFSSF